MSEKVEGQGSEPDFAAEWAAVAAEREAENGSAPIVKEEAPAQAAAGTEKTEATTASTAAAEPAKSEPEDPYKDLPADVQAKLKAFDAMSGTVSGLEQRLKEATGRIGSLQSEFAKTRKAAGDAPNQKQIAEAAKDPEKWTALKADFPEWGDGIEAFVDARMAGLKSGLSSEDLEQLVASKTNELSATFERKLLAVKYPGWETEVNTPDFEAWFKAQAPETQALAASDSGLDAIHMLDLFAEHKAKPVAAVKDERKERLAAAASSHKPGARVATKTFEDMTPAEQWAYMAADRAKRDAANRL